jgi:hypothetical protein
MPADASWGKFGRLARFARIERFQSSLLHFIPLSQASCRNLIDRGVADRRTKSSVDLNGQRFLATKRRFSVQ